MKKLKFTFDLALRLGMVGGILAIVLYLVYHAFQYGWQYVITNP